MQSNPSSGITSNVYICLLGLLPAVWSLLGYDSTAHMIEETTFLLCMLSPLLAGQLATSYTHKAGFSNLSRIILDRLLKPAL